MLCYICQAATSRLAMRQRPSPRGAFLLHILIPFAQNCKNICSSALKKNLQLPASLAHFPTKIGEGASGSSGCWVRQMVSPIPCIRRGRSGQRPSLDRIVPSKVIRKTRPHIQPESLLFPYVYDLKVGKRLDLDAVWAANFTAENSNITLEYSQFVGIVHTCAGRRLPPDICNYFGACGINEIRSTIQAHISRTQGQGSSDETITLDAHKAVTECFRVS